MQDPRLEKLADVLIHHSTKLQAGERVLIEGFDMPEEMILALIRKVREVGGVPMVTLKNNRVQRELIRAGDAAIMENIGAYEAFRMNRVDAYIALRGSNNISEMSDVSGEAMDLYETHWLKPVHFDIRVPNTNWVVLRWPTASMAQQAQMSTETFEDFYFDVCTLDYGKMADAAEALKARMENSDRVRLTGVNTDLRFSIQDISAIPCSGSHNIPDGECFTAPVRDSVNGTIHYNVPTIYRGTPFSDICLTFENGQIVAATSSDTDKLNEILDTDEGARYIGEFAIGFNPYITKPMLDILFDEKIAGSFHFTPGQAYEDADNGNRSAVHWDMVFIQTPEYGGGEIYFDDECIRKDGLFVVPDLEALNPENLK
ncbi:MAG: aminopeptidase [Candidatus Latescibacteria bacterium]|jgi:aminopeptidase|nr:aminopeptidase [Candidatus Latescibacterota bacterium]MBT4137149.1 aminopeptidase [Candidatus Latescibacterota bacterium]